jgi:hypothetical protein
MNILLDDKYRYLLNEYNWQITEKGYVYGYVSTLKRKILIHRYILYLENILDDLSNPLEVDHVNRNPLDNRLCNLRICTRSQNQAYTTKRPNKTSQYKGVYKRNRIKKPYLVQIRIDGKKQNIGSFSNEIEAARAYDKVAKEVYGDFAFLNFP